MRLFLLFMIAFPLHSAVAQSPQLYDSKNFKLQTDLPKEDAEELLEKLETMLVLVSKYWAVPNRQKIECVVVADLRNWSGTPIDPRALPSLKANAGITFSDFRRRGNRTSIRAVAFGVARTSIVQHEAVHAYAYYAFGHCGPPWYAEGMAEMGSYWIEGDTTVTAPRHVTEYLRRSKPRKVKEITTGETGKIGSWQNYCWRWALCHLLATNKNYSKKFRPLGLAMLTKKKGSFSSTYGKQLRELEFEYGFFLKHVQPGFDAERCSWDWDARFRKLKPTKSVRFVIRADRGWQASRVRLEAGQKYKLTAEGSWQLTKDGEPVSASGTNNSGQLVGVVMTKMKLGEPFVIGEEHEYMPRVTGDLYLRCGDAWNSLGDNSGEISVSAEKVE